MGPDSLVVQAPLGAAPDGLPEGPGAGRVPAPGAADAFEVTGCAPGFAPIAASFGTPGVPAGDAAEDLPAREPRPVAVAAVVVPPPVAAAVESGDAGAPEPGTAPVTSDWAAAPAVAGALTPERARTSASVRLDPQPAVASARATAAAPSCDRRMGSIEVLLLGW